MAAAAMMTLVPLDLQRLMHPGVLLWHLTMGVFKLGTQPEPVNAEARIATGADLAETWRAWRAWRVLLLMRVGAEKTALEANITLRPSWREAGAGLQL